MTKKISQAGRQLAAIKVGEIAEAKVKEIFNLEEPYIEIKSCCSNYYRAIIRALQLKNNYRCNKTYCIVIYDRGGVKNKCSVDEAFENRLLWFYFIGARQLTKIIRKDESRYLRDNSPPSDRGDTSFYHVKLSSIKRLLSKKHGVEYKGHRIRILGNIPPQEEIPF